MRREELSALGALAGDAAAGIAGQARDVHRSIATRVFRALGPPAAPVRAIHDRVSDRAYSGACALTGGVVKGAAVAASLARRRRAIPPAAEQQQDDKQHHQPVPDAETTHTPSSTAAPTRTPRTRAAVRSSPKPMEITHSVIP